jgi:hypothetical protein
MTSPIIENLIFINNFAVDGGAVMALDGDPVIRNCVFGNNEADYGGAMFFNNGADPIISRCLFYGNWAYTGGGVIYAETNSSLNLDHCTLSHNRSSSAGGIEIRSSDIELTNSIISFSEFGVALTVRGTPRITIEYTDIYANAGGDWTGPISELPGQYGNFSLDPEFADPQNADYHLDENSPCIDAGDPSAPYDPDNTITDIGTFYFDQATGIAEPDHDLPSGLKLISNYPNPFNVSTVIKYIIPEASRVKLHIYDCRGRKVLTLLDSEQPSGEHSVTLNASKFTSGVYFCRIIAGGFSDSRKLVLIK